MAAFFLPNLTFQPGRRRLLQVGVAGSALLALAACGQRGLAAFSVPKAAEGWLALRQSDQGLINSLLDALLQNALPSEIEARDLAKKQILHAMDAHIAAMIPSMRAELAQLFDLLTFLPTRGLLAGQWLDWRVSSVQDVRAFLDDWRTSSVSLFRAGYKAFHDLSVLNWYALPMSWERIGYVPPA